MKNDPKGTHWTSTNINELVDWTFTDIRRLYSELNKEIKEKEDIQRLYSELNKEIKENEKIWDENKWKIEIKDKLTKINTVVDDLTKNISDVENDMKSNQISLNSKINTILVNNIDNKIKETDNDNEKEELRKKLDLINKEEKEMKQFLPKNMLDGFKRKLSDKKTENNEDVEAKKKKKKEGKMKN